MKLSINKSVVYQDIEEEKVVLNLETNKYHSLNKYGLIIWNLIEKEKIISFETLVKKIQDHYHIENDSIIDIKEYILRLHSLSLINIENEEKI